MVLYPCFLCKREIANCHDRQILLSDATKHLLPVLGMILSSHFEQQQVDRLLTKPDGSACHLESAKTFSNQQKTFTVEFNNCIIISMPAHQG